MRLLNEALIIESGLYIANCQLPDKLGITAKTQRRRDAKTPRVRKQLRLKTRQRSVRYGSGSDRTHETSTKVRTQNSDTLECGRYRFRTVPSAAVFWDLSAVYILFVSWRLWVSAICNRGSPIGNNAASLLIE